MKISHIKIKNYRNLKNIDINIDNTVVLIGENNSGKSNFLKAITFPFIADELGFVGKNLGWIDINNAAKEKYYNYLLNNKDKIISDTITPEELITNMPSILVELQLKPEENEIYYIKDLAYSIKDENIIYGIKYEFKPYDITNIVAVVTHIVKNKNLSNNTIEKLKMNLLPIEYYSYSVTTLNNTPISYDTLRSLKYTSLDAERDDFSRTKSQLGSKALVKLFQTKLTNDDKLEVEEQYHNFFQQLKLINNKINSIINWQELSNFKDATSFFEQLSILPNMPSLNTFLNSIRLGYSDSDLTLQGLGHRNLILLLVLMNSLLVKKEPLAFNLLTLEEPEAHLCINNIKLMSSFIKTFSNNAPTIHLFYSTHSIEFINKINLRNILVIHDGQTISFLDELNDRDMDYLSKIPNLDLFKLFFSKKCILVEGISEELLIRAYIDSKKDFNDIDVLSFHKGYTKIINIWKRINSNSNNKLGIIRDYDNEPNAQKNHDKLSDDKNICIRTTEHITLEPEIINTGNNFEILKNMYGEILNWKNLDKETISRNWCNSKSSIMLLICKDIVDGNLLGFSLPKHIQEVIDFMSNKSNC